MKHILICDSSMKKISIILLEPFLKDKRLKFNRGEIIAIKYGKIAITETNIKKLNTTHNTILQNSTGDYQQDLLLFQFYRNNPDVNKFIFIYRDENYKYLKDIKEIMEKNVQNNITKCRLTFTTKAYIKNFYLDKNSIYQSCPLCSKKLKQIDNNQFDCISCNKTYHEPKYLFKLIFRVQDIDSDAYFTLLGTKANYLLGVEPELVKQYLEENKTEELNEIINKVLFKEYIFNATLTVFGKDKQGKILQNININ